jgi:hypothetical protein
MSAPLRLVLFTALLVAVFGGAVVAGGALDPEGAGDSARASAPHGDEDGGDGTHGAAAGREDHGGAASAPGAPPGLAVAEGGLRLELTDDRVDRGARRPLAFRIVDAHGRTVRDFDVAHEKRMHFIVVRRDLDGFQHLHPEMAADGTWTTDVDLREGGTYRVFADFERGGVKTTLGADVHVPGAFEPRAVPAAGTTATDDRGLEVRLRRDGGRVAFDVVRDGRVINDELDPYLGAKGHLVTLRTGDLAYLHTHPDGDELAFETELPSAGTYRMWVQFRLDGRVHTAAFTQEQTA